MRLFRPGFPAALLYPGAILRIRTKKKLLYLTFDDGPDPDSTPNILDILSKYHVRAVFFCRGSAAERYPDLMNSIRKGDHLVGNHGYNHLKGWRISLKKYTDDIAEADELTSNFLFRPPYGLLSPCQYFKLKKKYKIVLWDLMPYDFDTSFGADNSLRILQKKIRPGSIIVFHDRKNISFQLIEKFILYAAGLGYEFINSLTGAGETG
jgi:peptidoglycan/xylan/chitin deacetylase (PgdA/CDA1 family)